MYHLLFHTCMLFWKQQCSVLRERSSFEIVQKVTRPFLDVTINSLYSLSKYWLILLKCETMYFIVLTITHFAINFPFILMNTNYRAQEYIESNTNLGTKELVRSSYSQEFLKNLIQNYKICATIVSLQFYWKRNPPWKIFLTPWIQQLKSIISKRLAKNFTNSSFS